MTTENVKMSLRAYSFQKWKERKNIWDVWDIGIYKTKL